MTALLNDVDSLAPIALHVILALIAGALIGSVWDTWREHRRRRAAVREFDRVALDALRWIHSRNR
jgi:hypothetical protein